MRIALFTDGISPYVLGGMQRHSYFIAKYLALNKIEVDLYHTNQSNLDIEKLEVFSDEEKKYIHSIVIDFPPPGKLPGHYLRRSYEYSKQIFNEYKKQKPVDFIYSKGFTAWYLLEQRKKQKINTPPVGVKFHGMNMFQVQPNIKSHLQSFMFRFPVKFILNNVDYVFSYGAKITEITQKIGVKKNKIINIPTGITQDWFNAPNKTNNPIKFIYIGRYERLKGIEEMCKAIKLLPNKKFEFHFVGPIPAEKQIEDARVIYHGETRDINTIKKLLDNTDVLLCPSYSEGMPNVVIEAMSRGCAIIATDVGASGVLVNNNNGWLLEKCNVTLIKNAIEDAINLNENELIKKKNASYNFASKNLLWENIAVKLVNELNRITASKPY
ncbi:MAG: glycosyltransferase family 4 protein [Bacteroidia bacterium]|nr:glycosyltransferase family 4 protein [Bacteroidia bacterium]